MSGLTSLVQQLEAYVQEELDLQSRTLAALGEQQRALFHGDLDAIRLQVEGAAAHLRGATARTARRRDLVRRLAAHYGVQAGTLTLSSICTRLGPEGERLSRCFRHLLREGVDYTGLLRRLGRDRTKLNVLGKTLPRGAKRADVSVNGSGLEINSVAIGC